jgi:hypothetical protein
VQRDGVLQRYLQRLQARLADLLDGRRGGRGDRCHLRPRVRAVCV